MPSISMFYCSRLVCAFKYLLQQCVLNVLHPSVKISFLPNIVRNSGHSKQQILIENQILLKSVQWQLRLIYMHIYIRIIFKAYADITNVSHYVISYYFQFSVSVMHFHIYRTPPLDIGQCFSVSISQRLHHHRTNPTNHHVVNSTIFNSSPQPRSNRMSSGHMLIIYCTYVTHTHLCKAGL